MDFFDNLGRKINDLADDASDKVKEFSQNNKLKSTIAEEEKKIEEAFLEIGKKLFETCHEEEEHIYSEIFNKIKASQAKIKESRDEMVKVKEGKQDKINKRRKATQTSNGDESVEKNDEAENEKVTPACSCGYQLTADSRFCSGCGKAVSQD